MHGACQNSRESRNKEGDFFGNGKCELQRHNGETGSVKGETKSAIFGKGKVNSQQLCEFLAWESVNSSPILARQ